MSQIWHPTQRQVSVLQNNLWGPFLGVHFRAPVLGSSFWGQFWDPVLDQIWDQKTSIVGPTFWDQIRVHFWGPNFGLAYIVNKGWIPGPSFGTKNGPSSGTKKNQKNGPDLAPKCGTQSDLTNTHPDLAPK